MIIKINTLLKWPLSPNAPFNTSSSYYFIEIELNAFWSSRVYSPVYSSDTAMVSKCEGCKEYKVGVVKPSACHYFVLERFVYNVVFLSPPPRSLAVGTKSGYKFFSLSSVDKLEQIYECSKYPIIRRADIDVYLKLKALVCLQTGSMHLCSFLHHRKSTWTQLHVTLSIFNCLV